MTAPRGTCFLRRPGAAVALAAIALVAIALMGPLSMPDAATPHLQPGRYVVDALEHPDLATLEGPDGGSLAVPRSWLPAHAREGDVLRTLANAGADAVVRFEVDAAATEERRRALQERRDGLPSGPSGDLEL